MSAKFSKHLRLLSRRDFTRVATAPKRKVFVSPDIIIEAIENPFNHCRIGITATRRFGNAVKRNRFKRSVREAFRLLPLDQLKAVDVVVKARNDGVQLSVLQIKTELLRLIGRYGSKNSFGISQQRATSCCGDNARALVDIGGRG